MNNLVIEDLDFCRSERSELKGGWLNIKVGVSTITVATPPSGGGYGTSIGAAIGIGNNPDGSPPLASVFTFVSGFRFP